VREDCTVRAESTPLAFEYCRPPKPGETEDSAVRDAIAGARVPEPV
jgi:hypothetical protein